MRGIIVISFLAWFAQGEIRALQPPSVKSESQVEGPNKEDYQDAGSALVIQDMSPATPFLFKKPKWADEPTILEDRQKPWYVAADAKYGWTKAAHILSYGILPTSLDDAVLAKGGRIDPHEVPHDVLYATPDSPGSKYGWSKSARRKRQLEVLASWDVLRTNTTG